MDTKEIKIITPEGMEIDKENSTFECIMFKKKEEVPWRNKKGKFVNGFYINDWNSEIKEIEGLLYNEEAYDVFATEKQTKSALAMARISQIMANDERFGGVVTDEEWANNGRCKHVIFRCKDDINLVTGYCAYHFLAFHTEEQRDLFLKENEDLVKQYLMLD